MRSISFSLTTPQFLDGSKTVTRRLGWTFLKPGDRLRAVKKCMGLKKGEHPEVLGEIEVVKVCREPLDHIWTHDVRAEGFDGMHPFEFVLMFRKHMKCNADTIVTRIEFRRTA